MHRIFFFILIFLFPYLNSTGQKKQILYCKGEIPKEILGLATLKYETDVSKIEKGKGKKTKKDFYLKSNFGADDLLKSGQILFGDELSNYVKSVAEEVLKSDPELLKRIKVFIVKSSEVNAFSSQQGFIFINIGMLAQLENEAQLAYLISHEATHIKYNHSINQYVNTDKLINGKGKYRSIEMNERKNIYYNYSKEDEFSADKLGLTEIFLKSNYSIEDAANLFDMLLYSDLPFDEIEFDTTYFNTKNFKLGSENILPTTAPITTIDNYNDDNLTHPNIKKRRESFIESSLEHSNKGRVSFIISQDTFLSMRNAARLELLNIYILEGEYPKALYSSFLLQQKNIDNEYVKYVADYCLYAASKHKSFVIIEKNIPKYDEIEGKSQQVYYMLSKIDKKDLCIIALNKIWREPDTSSYSAYNRQMVESLIADLVVKYDVSSGEIVRKYNSLSDTSFKELPIDEYNALTKFEKIKYDKTLQLFKENLPNSKSANSLLIDLIVDDDFVKTFNEVESKYKQKPPANNDNLTPKEERILDRTNRKIAKHKTLETINSLCVLNPGYEYYNSTSEDADLMNSEKGKVNLISNIIISSRAASINIKMLDAYSFHHEDADLYNNLNIAVSWSMEVGAQLKNNIFNKDSNQIRMMPFTQPLMDEYLAKSGTENILYTTLYSNNKIDYMNNTANKFIILPSLIFYPLLPATLYYFLTYSKSTQISNICVNAKKGSIVSINYSDVNCKDYNFLIKSQYYNYFQKLLYGKY